MIVFDLPAKFACRSCGATFLPSDNAYELCSACLAGCRRWLTSVGIKEISENGISKYLARKLYLEGKRLEKYGVTGRCEAIARASNGWLGGTLNQQCRGHAVEIRDGRRVCAAHAVKRCIHITYAGEAQHDPYTCMEQLLVDLAAKDKRFRQCVLTAAATIPKSETEAA